MRVLFVDDDEQILRALSRMIDTEIDDWEVDTAISGAEALERLRAGAYDVVVTDMRMPEMDGADLLEIVEREFPGILRVVLSGQADRESVLRAIRPMHQYLAKPCSPEVLIETIRRARIFHDTITSTEVLNAIGQANCIPSLPDVVTEINTELESDRCTSASLAKIVSKDPVLCAKMLQLANSAIFGMRSRIVDVERALSVLGVDLIRSLAISLKVFSGDQKNTADAAARLFQHSFDVAEFARRLARLEKLDSQTANMIFSAGLLHDIGKIVLLNAFGDRYRNIQRQAKDADVPEWQLELLEFGASHSGIGAYLLELWGLPESIIETVAAHHTPEVCIQAGTPSEIVFAANWIAHGGDGQIAETAGAPEASLDAFLNRLQSWRDQIAAEDEQYSEEKEKICV